MYAIFGACSLLGCLARSDLNAGGSGICVTDRDCPGAVCAAGVCKSPPATVFDPAWADLAYTGRYRLAINHTKLASSLSDYPLAVVLGPDAALAAALRPDAGDLEFFLPAATTRLSHEVETYDSSSGTLAVWVRVPFASAAVDTEIDMYFGNSGATGTADPHGLWSGIAASVWHLSENCTYPNPAHDSTVNANDATAPAVGQSPTRVDGVIGDGQSFNGTNNELDVPSPANGSLDFDTTKSFSISVWINYTNPVGSYDFIAGKGGTTNSSPGYDIDSGTCPWAIGIADGTRYLNAFINNCTAYWGGWTLLTLVVDRAGQLVSYYADGVLQATLDISTITNISNTFPFTIGGDQPVNAGQDWYRGVIDEVRVYPNALTPSWIAAEYANLLSPATFISILPGP